VNGHAPEKGTRERACSGIWVVLFQFFVFSSCLRPIFGANGHEKRGFEWSTFSLKLKWFYSKVGGYAPEYVYFNNYKIINSNSIFDIVYFQFIFFPILILFGKMNY
jgi:hypothetical protein